MRHIKTGTHIKIGTRGSKLALYQANLVKDKLLSIFKHKNIEIEIKAIKTSGDKILTASLSAYGGKGLFVKEIEDALLKGDIDIAVHSLKDVPQTIPESLVIGCVLKRDDPRDCIILKDKPSLNIEWVDITSWLKKYAIIGSSSLRRQSLLKRLRDDLVFEPLRGNIDTRLAKLKKGYFDAIILSSSGLIRLGLSSYIDVYLDPNVFIPQCGQGVIAIEYAIAGKEIHDMLQPLNDEDTYIATFAERLFIKKLDCGCASPVGAYAQIKDGKLHIKGFVSNMYGDYLEEEINDDKINFKEIGKKLAAKIIEKGGLEILSKNSL